MEMMDSLSSNHQTFEKRKKSQQTIQWSLSAQDKALIFEQCKGAQPGLYFAIQLCALRSTGDFLPNIKNISPTACQQLSVQLDLGTPTYPPKTVSKNTQTAYHNCISDYLGYSAFTKEAEVKLKQWMARQLQSSLCQVAELKKPASEWFKNNRIIKPAAATLNRLMKSYRNQAIEDMYTVIANKLSQPQKKALLALLKTDETAFSAFNYYKKSPPEPTANLITTFIERYQHLDAIGIPNLTMADINPKVIEQLAELAKHYDARALKRMQPANKRLSLLLCFLIEAGKTLLDHIVEMNDVLLIKKERLARNKFEKNHKSLRKQAKSSLKMLITTVRKMLKHENPRQTTLWDFYRTINETKVEKAADVCEQLSAHEGKGYYKLLEGKYNDLRKYTPHFFKLDFKGGSGTETLMLSISLLQKLNSEEISALPEDAPTDFIPVKWLAAMQQEDGSVTRRTWEMALYYAVKNAIAAGDLYLKQSRHHRYFWNTVYEEEAWQQEKPKAYQNLGLPTQFDTVFNNLKKEFREGVSLAEKSLGKNTFAYINDKNQLRLRKEDALIIPESTLQLRDSIEEQLPKIRIEKLLREVDATTGFSHYFIPPEEFTPQKPLSLPVLYATLIAHGANIGLAGMAHSTVNITEEMLRQVSEWYINKGTLHAASGRLVDVHHQHPLSKLYGDGSRSGSDGDRFKIQKSTSMASFYPKLYGYYEKIITIYTHLSDQLSVFNTQVISCGKREAAYVLAGLLSHNSSLSPRFHSTDTGGYTDHLFALCFLLGISFQPRLKDIPHQALYKIDKDNCGDIERLFKQAVDMELIRESWDQFVRIAASLKDGLSPAHVVLQKLSGRGRSDSVAKGLGELGKLIKTIYILNYVSRPELRRVVQLQLNRGESRHSLARHVFFADQGEFKTADCEEIMNIASCLSLLSNAILVWNTPRIAAIIESLRQQGKVIDDADIARVSLLMFGHIIVHGMYNFSR